MNLNHLSKLSLCNVIRGWTYSRHYKMFLRLYYERRGWMKMDYLKVSLFCVEWENILFKFNDSRRYRRTVGSIAGSCIVTAVPLLASQNQATCLVALDIIEVCLFSGCSFKWIKLIHIPIHNTSICKANRFFQFKGFIEHFIRLYLKWEEKKQLFSLWASYTFQLFCL